MRVSVQKSSQRKHGFGPLNGNDSQGVVLQKRAPGMNGTAGWRPCVRPHYWHFSRSLATVAAAGIVSHGHGSLPSGHRRTMTAKVIANIKTKLGESYGLLAFAAYELAVLDRSQFGSFSL
jgi:hypothetical protein